MCARTSSDRFTTAVHVYAGSWASTRADSERRHLRARVYDEGVVRMRMRVRRVRAGERTKKKKEWNKWKNHFYEMKREVGMPRHEKERQQEVAYTKTESNS